MPHQIKKVVLFHFQSGLQIDKSLKRLKNREKSKKFKKNTNFLLKTLDNCCVILYKNSHELKSS